MVPAALPPGPVAAPTSHVRHAVAVGMLLVVFLLIGLWLSMPETPLVTPPPAPAPVVHLTQQTTAKPAVAPKLGTQGVTPSYEKAPDDSAGINLSIESQATEVKADELLARAKRKAAASETAVQEEATPVPPVAKSPPVEKSDKVTDSVAVLPKKEQEAAASKPKPAAVSKKDLPKKVVVKKEPVKKEAAKKEKTKKPELKLVVQEAKISPTDEALNKAEACLQAKDWKGALALYDEVLKTDKTNRAALKGKVFLIEQKSPESALDSLDALADRYPSVAFIHAARARILVRENDTLEALKAWERAVRLEPQNNDYRLGLAVLQDRLGHADEALRLYQQLPKPLPAQAQERLDFLAKQKAGN